MVSLLLIDSQKAFDTVSHSILSRKLQAIGISGITIYNLDSFLSDAECLLSPRWPSISYFYNAYGLF